MAKYDSLNLYLTRISERVTLTWPQLDDIVGGLPASATEYRAWWSGGHIQEKAWKSAGFEVKHLQLGSQVTFVRTSSNPVRNSEANAIEVKNVKIPSVDQGEKKLIKPNIVLISCVKTKRREAAAAKDLYISDLFHKERAYAERTGAPWYILSSEHGLVTPDQWLAPYERYLPNESSAYQRKWGSTVVEELEKVESSLNGKVIEVHANAVYLSAIRSGLESRGAIISDPLSGLSFGRKLQWYKRILSGS